MAWPLTAHTTGRGSPYQAMHMRLMPSTMAFWPAASSVGTSLRSAPAEKNPGRPVSTIAPGASAASASAALIRSPSSPGSIALAGGRSSATTATSPRRSIEAWTMAAIVAYNDAGVTEARCAHRASSASVITTAMPPTTFGFGTRRTRASAPNRAKPGTSGCR